MPLHEWSPTTQLAKLDRDFEDIIDHFMSHDWGVRNPSSLPHHAPAIESFVDAGRLVVRADLPGVDPKDVEIGVEGSLLTIKGSRTAASNREQQDFVHREIRYGSFERAISIPNGVKKKDISASHRNGVLELTIPLAQATEVKKIPVEIAKRAKEPEKHR
jgi:HSP20 family protein